MKTHTHSPIALFSLLLTVLLAACSNTTGSLTGQVTYTGETQALPELSDKVLHLGSYIGEVDLSSIGGDGADVQIVTVGKALSINTSGGDYYNYCQAQERWIRGKAGYYVTLPDGTLKHWKGGSSAACVFDETFAVAMPKAFYDDRTEYTRQTNEDAQGVATAIVNDNTLFITLLEKTAVGIEVTKDGTTTSFIVYGEESSANGAVLIPTIPKEPAEHSSASIAMQSLEEAKDQSIYLHTEAGYFDLSSIGGDGAEVQIVTVGKALSINTSGGDYLNYCQSNEHWMTGKNGWYTIEPDGTLKNWKSGGGNGCRYDETFSVVMPTKFHTDRTEISLQTNEEVQRTAQATIDGDTLIITLLEKTAIGIEVTKNGKVISFIVYGEESAISVASSSSSSSVATSVSSSSSSLHGSACEEVKTVEHGCITPKIDGPFYEWFANGQGFEAGTYNVVYKWGAFAYNGFGRPNELRINESTQSTGNGYNITNNYKNDGKQISLATDRGQYLGKGPGGTKAYTSFNETIADGGATTTIEHTIGKIGMILHLKDPAVYEDNIPKGVNPTFCLTQEKIVRKETEECGGGGSSSSSSSSVQSTTNTSSATSKSTASVSSAVSSAKSSGGQCTEKLPEFCYEEPKEWDTNGGPIELKEEWSFEGTTMLLPPVVALLEPGATVPTVLNNVQVDGAWALVALDGETGNLKWKSNTWSTSPPVVGDIDGDGENEIVTYFNHYNNVVSLVALSHDGKTIEWETKKEYTHNSSTTYPPLIADINRDGTVEVIAGHIIYNGKDGSILMKAPTGIIMTYDVTDSSELELITSQGIYTSDNPMTPICTFEAGIGTNFGISRLRKEDTYYTIVANASHQVRIKSEGIDGGYMGIVKAYRGDNCEELFSTTYGVSNYEGDINIADFNGDGDLEIAAGGGKQEYVVIDANGDIMWKTPIVDRSGGWTGGTAFDFYGKGYFDAVYADEEYLYIMDGKSGEIVAKIPNTSSTGYENPIVVDVNNDGRANIVVTAGNKIRVFSAPNNDWVGTRPIWNDQAYYALNVADNGSLTNIDTESIWKPYLDSEHLVGFRNNIPHRRVKVTNDPRCKCGGSSSSSVDTCNNSQCADFKKQIQEYKKEIETLRKTLSTFFENQEKESDTKVKELLSSLITLISEQNRESANTSVETIDTILDTLNGYQCRVE